MQAEPYPAVRVNAAWLKAMTSDLVKGPRGERMHAHIDGFLSEWQDFMDGRPDRPPVIDGSLGELSMALPKELNDAFNAIGDAIDIMIDYGDSVAEAQAMAEFSESYAALITAYGWDPGPEPEWHAH